LGWRATTRTSTLGDAAASFFLWPFSYSGFRAVRFREAIDYFNKALSGAVGMQGAAGIWAGTHCNLGHAYRQLLQVSCPRNQTWRVCS
jgi:hypothetical protein